MNNVLKGYKKNNNIKGHGACFPVELVKDLVNAFSKEGDIVLDPFMGSGTTAVAALECNRKYIGFEIIILRKTGSGKQYIESLLAISLF